MKRFLVFFITLFTLINWIHAKNEAHGDTFTVELEEHGTGPYNGAFRINIESSLKLEKDFLAAEDFTFGGTAASDDDITVEITTGNNKSRKDHRAKITPTRSGILTIKIEADAIEKNANTNEESNELSVTIDMDAPTVSFEDVPTSPKNGAFDIKVKFDEDVTGFDDDGNDITFRGTASATASIAEEEADEYTVTIAPSADGTLTITVPADAATDTATNGNTEATTSTVTIDMTAPTVSFEDVPSGTQTEAFDITVNFDEDVTDFDDAADITLGGTATATAAISEDAADEYTVTITPTTEGTVTITVPADAATDTATNGNTASTTSDEIDVDPVHPTVTLSGAPSGPQNDDFDITITFSEDVDGFDDDDITFGGTATATASVSGSDKNYTATITPTASGDLTIKVAADEVDDTNGNGNEVSNELTVTIDVTPPTVSFANLPTTPQNAAFNITVRFSEDVTGFVQGDVNTHDPRDGSADATITAFSGGPQVYSVTIRPPGAVGGTGSPDEFDMELYVNADAAKDLAGNGNTASPGTPSVPIDTIVPTVVSITGLPTTEQKAAFPITVTFSEAMKDFAKEDVTINGPATATGMSVDTAKKVYTVTITPNAGKEGDVTFQINANVATDNAGNNNTAFAATTAVHIDTKAPTATISTPPTTEQKDPFDLTITFNEDVTGFVVADDLEVTGPASASSTGTPTATVYTVRITPNTSSEGDVTVKVKANAVKDAAQNDNPASAVTPTVRVDTIDPTVKITGVPTMEKNVAFDITITFSEEISGFALADDLTVSSGATTGPLTETTTNKVYTVTITPDANQAGADISFQVLANAVTDNAGNSNPVSPPTVPAFVHVDTVAPTVAIGGLPPGEQKDPFTITVTFSEAMKDFTKDDVTVNGLAAATGMSVDTAKEVYTVTITPNATSEGDVTFQIAANVATDEALNNNPASTVTTAVRIDTIVPTATISTPPTPEQKDPFDLTITFLEDVTGFVVPDDLEITGPATASLKGTVTANQVFTVTITPNPTSEGDVTVQVKANAVKDAAQNDNPASAVTPTVRIDTIVPTATISTPPTPEQKDPFDLTITFLEDVTGFVVPDDLEVTGPATASLKGTPTAQVYTVTITPDPTSEGGVTVQVKANAVKDAAQNDNPASAVTPTVHIDTIVPTVEITGVPDIEKNELFDLTVTFSEPVNGFTTASVAINGAATATAASANADNSVYTVTITPNDNQEGDNVSFEVPANAVQDHALNDNTVSPATTPASVHIDTVVPTVTLSDPPTDEQNGPFDLTVTFSEEVNGFAAGDVAVTGPATASLAAGGDGDDEYTVTITPDPTSEDDVTVQVSANTVKDFALNDNTASAVTPDVHIDTIPPTVAITRFPTEIQYEFFSVRIEFPEDVTDFELDDIAFSGDAVVEEADLTAESEQAWTLTITPHEDTDGDIIITVPADVAIDAALNNNVASAPQAVPVAPLWIPDPNLRIALRLELGLDEGEDFSRTDLSLLTAFAAAAPQQIIDLTGLEYAINLTRMDLSGTGITDLTALATLTDLTALNLNDNDITFIAPLEDMTALTLLELKGNSVSDLTPLAGLTALKTLNLRENAVVDVTPLAELTMLNHLDLTANRIRDVAPLLALKNLVTLRLSGNPLLNPDILAGLAETIEIDGTLPDLTPDPGLSQGLRAQLGTDPTKRITAADLKGRNTLELEGNDIKDLSGLEHATDLTTLDLSNNNITDITSLQNLTELTILNLKGNNIINITVLQGLTQLTTLDLSNNNITDIMPLQGLTELKILKLGGNNIADITLLQGLTELTTLDLSNNNITDITLLPTFTELTTLHLSNNPIGDLGPLAALTDLTTLELSGHGLSDLDIISGLTALRTLNLSDNAITSSSLNAIAGLTALTHLNISGNVVTDAAPLAGFTRLTTLNASHNNISDVQPLAALANLRTLRLTENPILNTAPLYPLTQRVPPIDSDIAIAEYPPWDVNEDSKVDAADSALVTAALGQKGRNIENPRTDVNGDGGVDNADLLLVTENLDNNPGAAPAALDVFIGLDRATLETLDRAQLKATLDRLLIESDGSLKYLRAIQLLQNLLAQLLPDETRLFANYPNPFNPETWIPYQLAKGGDVEIFIYDARGVLVRHLSLGHQRAGYYTEKSRAAYWDGRNSIGERVASGIYFYRLQAADTSLLRKMLILK